MTLDFTAGLVAPASCRRFFKCVAQRETAGGTPASPEPPSPLRWLVERQAGHGDCREYHVPLGGDMFVGDLNVPLLAGEKGRGC